MDFRVQRIWVPAALSVESNTFDEGPQKQKQRASIRFVRPHFVEWNRFEKKWLKQR